MLGPLMFLLVASEFAMTQQPNGFFFVGNVKVVGSTGWDAP